jgi:hypothetical protein
MPRFFLPFAVCLCLASYALGWGTKEHIQLTRIAAERLIDDPSTPAQMKQWLRMILPEQLDMEAERQWFMNQRQGIVPRGVDSLCYWCGMPDVTIQMEPRGQEKKIAPFGVSERLLHYIDLEMFVSGNQKREYRHDLSGKPKLADIPRDMKDERYLQAGMLPFRVVDCYEELVKQLSAGRLSDKPGQYPRDEHAAKWAGYLAHYLEDNTQPQHATIDYKSATYFANKRKAPNVHAQVEYEMVDDEFDDHMELRKEYWPAFAKALDEVKDPIETKDLWQATCEVSLASYDALPMIGVAAMAAAKQGGTPEKPEGDVSNEFNTEVFFHSTGKYNGREMTVLEMKAYQQAWAVKRVEKMLRQAWDEAQKKGRGGA